MRADWQGTAWGAVRAGALAGALTTVTACGAFGPDRDEALPDPDVVARDLVYTLAQVPELHPLKSTLQVGEPITPFGERVHARLEEAGYGLQRVAPITARTSSATAPSTSPARSASAPATRLPSGRCPSSATTSATRREPRRARACW